MSCSSKLYNFKQGIDMQLISTICLFMLSLYGNAQSPQTVNNLISDAASGYDEDNNEDYGEVDEDIIIMDEEDTNDDEGVSN
ncbi:MAG: hypothetical protein WA347_04735 [Rhabdochlamydiaceae bacterium]|jgi:hypothetical protein